jgi:NAD(P)-dependent dehydrogenase (short-subunit alcohol dehydrogenase family)
MSVAWVLGPSGTWGAASARELLDRGFDVVGLGPRDVPSLGTHATERGCHWSFAPLDLGDMTRELAARLSADPPHPGTLPDMVVDAALSLDGDRDALVRANFLGKAALLEAVAAAMASRGSGRIGVLVPQNARLGLAGLGDLAAPQAALWTWAESLGEELRAAGRGVTLTIVIPPRAASDTQRLVSLRSGRSAKVHPPDPGPLVAAILAGRRRAGRRPVLAALALLR